MEKAMGMVGMTSAGPEGARATSKYHICLFWDLEKPKKAFKITVMIAYLHILHDFSPRWMDARRLVSEKEFKYTVTLSECRKGSRPRACTTVHFFDRFSFVVYFPISDSAILPCQDLVIRVARI